MAQQNLLRPCEHREGVDRPLHGVLSSWESGSGSKKVKGSGAAIGVALEVLGGQMRVKSDLPYDVRDLNAYAAIEKYLDTHTHPAYRLTGSADTTPEFMISLSQIFTGWMGQNLELPVELINPNDNIEIELDFTDDGSWGSNDRAIS